MGTMKKGQGDALLALRNAAKLGGSLMFTWGIALGVRLLLPRYLGPDAFGAVNFADAFTSTAFVVIGLGLDTFIRKEVSVRADAANDFFAGVTLVRVLGAVALFGLMQGFLMVSGRPPETWLLVHVFGGAAFFFTMNQSFAALLHAKGTVNELSVLNIATKLVWGVGTLLAVVLGWPLWALAMAVLVSEALKTVASVLLVNKHLAMRWRWNALAVKTAIVSSLPIFLNVAAHTIYNKLDVSILAVVANDREVAWYGASSLVAGLALMVTPMIGWVLMPLFARARARSDEEYTQVMRRSLELVLAIAFPTSLFMALGASEWVVLLYGPAYAQAAVSLKILASIFVLTYVAILSANALILTGRAWAQAGISISGLAVNPLLNWFFIPRAMVRFGEGGAGVGAAIAQLGTEIVVTVLMTALVGARAFDRRSVVMIAKTLGVCVAVSLLDRWLDGRMPGLVRIAIEVVVYVGLVAAVRAVRVHETLAFARAAFARKQPPAEPDVPAVLTPDRSTS
jgi:O-antigen/teichoic acid export membrane protein